MYYVGVDAHRKVTQLTVMDVGGAIVKRQRIASTREAILEALGEYGCECQAVMEASYSWGPMYDWLTAVTERTILAHPAKVRAIASARIKTDKIDSAILAHLLRTNLVPEAYAPSAAVRAKKRVLRQRLFLVRIRTMQKLRIRALIAQHGLMLPEVSDLFGVAGLKWLTELQLPEPDGQLLRDDLRLYTTLQEHLAASTDQVTELGANDPAVTLLASLPGIGAFLSVLIRHEVDNIARFASEKQFAAYTGLVPSTYASGERRVNGRITRQGNKWLRWAFVEAVSPAVVHSPWIRRYYLRRKLRGGIKNARVATARKLAELTWRIWTEQRPYREPGPAVAAV